MRAARLATLLKAAAALIAAPASADASSAHYAPTSLLALRVGDGVYCPSDNVSCSVAAPLYLDEYDLRSGMLVSSVPVLRVTLSATDQYVGSLSRSADGVSVAFGANTEPAGTVPNVTAGKSNFDYDPPRMNFVGARVIVRVNSSGSVDTSTRLSAADYNGIIKGVCSFDGSGFWVAGNATNTCISYVAFGSAANTSNVINVAHDANCVTADGIQNSFYWGCTAIASPNRLFFTRVFNDLGQNHLDVPVPPTQNALWTAPGGLNIRGSSGTGSNNYGTIAWAYSQMVVNRAQSAFWVANPWDALIAYGTNLPALPDTPPGSISVLAGGFDERIRGVISGLTLSLDEKMLYFAIGRTIYWIYSTPEANGFTPNYSSGFSAVAYNALLTLPASMPFFEFRGIALAPQTCASPGLYCEGGASLPALPCAAGYWCSGNGVQTVCQPGTYCPPLTAASPPPCPAGTACPGGGTPPQPCTQGFYSAGGLTATSCTSCSRGIFCGLQATNNTTPCPAGLSCPGGGVAAILCSRGSFSAAGATFCTPCSAGILCSTQATNNTTPCPAGSACPGGGVAASTCAARTFAATGASSCTPCPPNSESFPNSATCGCIAGFASNGLVGAGLVCTACGAGLYSFGSLATACSPCPSTAAFVSAAQGCSPLGALLHTANSSAVNAGAGFALSGASAEGIAAFAAVINPMGISYATSAFGMVKGALNLSMGASISSSPFVTAPTSLPTGNEPVTLSAWVKCSLPVNGQASVLEWGLPGRVGAPSKVSLMVGHVNGGNSAASGALVSLIAGNGNALLADNTNSLSASFNGPNGLAIDPATGDIYVADHGDFLSVRVINATTGSVTSSYSSTNITDSASGGLHLDNTTIYIAGQTAIYTISRATGKYSILAGGGLTGMEQGTQDGVGTNGLFGFTGFTMIDSTSTYFYASDFNNAKVRRITIATGLMTTLAGGGASGHQPAPNLGLAVGGCPSTVDGVGTNALFGTVEGFALYAADTILFVSDACCNTIRRIDLATLVVTTVVPHVLWPWNMIIDEHYLYVFMWDGLQKISLTTNKVYDFLNDGNLYGGITDAQFDASGSLIVSDNGRNYILKVVQAPLVPACGDGLFHHIALTQGDGGATTRKTYLDGVLLSAVTGQTYAIPASGSSLRIGWNGMTEPPPPRGVARNGVPFIIPNPSDPPVDVGDHFSGVMSDLRIYNRALSAAEIRLLMQPPTFTLPPTPPTAPASPVGAIVAGVLVLLIAAAAMRVRSERARRRRVLKAEAEAAPTFAIDFAAGEITAANPLNSAGRLAVGSGAPPLSSGAPSGVQVHEVAWSDLVPDLSYAPMFGGFGIVFVARWVSKKKLVAVKVPKLAALTKDQSRAAVQMLLAEAQGLMRASDGGINEHVVQVFGVAQGKAEGWQAALLVSKEAEARKLAKKAKAMERKSKRLGFSAVGTWVGGESTVGGFGMTTMAVTTTATSSFNDSASAAIAADENNEDEEDDDDEGDSHSLAAAAAKAKAKLAEDAAEAGGERAPAPFLFGLVMSFEAGGSLDAKLFPRRSGRASWPSKMADRLRVIKEAAAGLYGLHAVGMVHSDLKPENVLLSGRADAPHVRLADFGLATIKSSAERASRISVIAQADEKRGTWPYMAPEMYRSKTAPPAAASRSTDVFAFGTLMHEVLSSRMPWAGFTEMDRVLALLRGESLDTAVLPKDTPPSVAALIARCLALDRAARPRTAEVLAILEQAYENIVSGHFDVFLSYAWGAKSARKPLADELYLALRAAGMRIWKDDLEMSHDLAASMSEGIAKSEVVVMLVSPAYAASEPCMYEARATAAAGKPLVTCCVEPGFWRSWLAADGSGTPALPDDHELVALARLKTHLFVDLGEASKVNWAGDSVPPSERKKLALPEALPRLLELLAVARKAGAGAAAMAQDAPTVTPKLSVVDPVSARTSTVARNTSAARNSSSVLVHESKSSAERESAASMPAAAPRPTPMSLAPAAPEPAPVAVWTRHRDGDDVWFVSQSGEAAWELPEGAEAVDAEAPAPAPEAAVTAAEAPHLAADEEPAAPAEPAKRKRLKGKVVKDAAPTS